MEPEAPKDDVQVAPATPPPPPPPPLSPPTTPPVIVQSGHDRGLEILLPINRSGVSIVAGYLGLFSLLPVIGLAAILVGCFAMYDFKKHPEKHGRGRAIFGIVMGVITSIAWAVVILGGMS